VKGRKSHSKEEISGESRKLGPVASRCRAIAWQAWRVLVRITNEKHVARKEIPHELLETLCILSSYVWSSYVVPGFRRIRILAVGANPKYLSAVRPRLPDHYGKRGIQSDYRQQ
jgi:hypothetical protein